MADDICCFGSDSTDCRGLRYYEVRNLHGCRLASCLSNVPRQTEPNANNGLALKSMNYDCSTLRVTLFIASRTHVRKFTGASPRLGSPQSAAQCR